MHHRALNPPLMNPGLRRTKVNLFRGGSCLVISPRLGDFCPLFPGDYALEYSFHEVKILADRRAEVFSITSLGYYHKPVRGGWNGRNRTNLPRKPRLSDRNMIHDFEISTKFHYNSPWMMIYTSKYRLSKI